MTRAAQLTQAVSATGTAPSSLPGPASASMTFHIDEDNGGGYHWTIVGDGGEILVRPPGSRPTRKPNKPRASSTAAPPERRSSTAPPPRRQSISRPAAMP